TTNSFVEACKAGTLPQYTFIEPRLFINHNDMHPPFAPLPHLLHAGPTVQSSVLAGEWLVWNVYNAVMGGAKWDRTLLVIIFDEHGGCYDHDPPPWGMIPPDDFKGEDGFEFNRLGVRVPAIFISAYIEPRTLVRAPEGPFNPFDHTSIIRTICNRWSLTTSLGARADSDKTADISAVLTRDRPRSRDDFPTLTPRPYTPLDEPTASSTGLTALQRDILGLVAAHSRAEMPKAETIADALEFLRSKIH
ncbi:MAG: alkaline phosphatase family protein, partial [Gemmatimonadales bacterium]